MTRSRSFRTAILGLLVAAIVGLPTITAWLIWPRWRENSIRESLRSGTPPPLWWPSSWRREHAIYLRLREPITLEFVDCPLGDIVDFLRDYTTVKVELDYPALEQK